MGEPGIDINGVAHVIFTVSDWEKSRPFYHMFLSYLGLKCVIDSKDKYQGGPFLYYVGGRTAIGIQQAKDEFKGRRFEQWSVGLHHVCLRVRCEEDLAKLQRFLEADVFPSCGGRLVHGVETGNWAPGYKSVLFEDPDGIRIELNYVPGKGLLGTKDQKLFSKL